MGNSVSLILKQNSPNGVICTHKKVMSIFHIQLDHSTYYTGAKRTDMDGRVSYREPGFCPNKAVCTGSSQDTCGINVNPYEKGISFCNCCQSSSPDFHSGSCGWSVREWALLPRSRQESINIHKGSHVQKIMSIYKLQNTKIILAIENYKTWNLELHDMLASGVLIT